MIFVYVSGLSLSLSLTRLLFLFVSLQQVFEFLYKFVEICKAYFGKLDEDVIKDNYVLVYELLDGTPAQPLRHTAAQACAPQRRQW
jgi:hypothetical protein